MSVYAKENPDYLRMSIESMLDQTMAPDQIVIVKDGRLTDELDEVISYYESRYPDIFTIVPLEKNVGLGRALNEGLKRCRNELVARMDTDDISVKERCELQVQEFLKNEELSIVGGIIDEFYVEPSNVIASRVVPLKNEDILKFSRRRNPFNHPTVMYKKSAVLECGGYGNNRLTEDYELFVRMLRKGYMGMNTNKTLVLFRADENYLKRRKKWIKCKENIAIIYHLWKQGHSGLFDLIIVALSSLIVYIMPLWFMKWVYHTFLRKVKSEEKKKAN